MSVDNYFVKVAGTWRETKDPEVHWTDFWIDLHEAGSDHRYFFGRIDEAAEACQDGPGNIVNVSPLLRVVIQDKPERWPRVKLSYLKIKEAKEA
jgi:hypothetical protein